MNRNIVKERIVFILTIMSFISITIQAIGTYIHNISSAEFCKHVEIRFIGMLLTELFISYFSWQMILTNSGTYSMNLMFCYLYLLISIVNKSICSGMSIMADILLFMIRILYIKMNYRLLQNTNICYRCTRYAMEENMYNILKVRVYIFNATGLYVLFSVITAVYTFIGELYFSFFVLVFLLLFNNTLSRFDRDESITVRIIFLIFYIFNIFYSVFLVKYVLTFKE